MNIIENLLKASLKPELDEMAAKGCERLLSRVMKRLVDRRVVIDRTGPEALTLYTDIVDKEGRPLGVKVDVQFQPLTTEKEVLAWAEKMGLTGTAAKRRGA